MSQKTTTASELLDEAYDLLKEKKTNSKHMNIIAADMSKQQKIEKPIMLRVKDYAYYRGRGYNPSNILGDKDPEEKFPDRVTPTFKKLLQIIDDLYAVGKQDMLDIYLDAMKNKGVEIKITNKDVRVSDIDETWQAIENMKGFQKNICELADEINFGCTQIAEDISFTPKEEFKGALGLYEKKRDERDCDDLYQEKVTDLELTQTAWNNIYDENL
jgi:hypothetical protein